MIGVRGTVLDISVQADRTRVTLREGGALVCPRRKEITFERQQHDCAKGRSAHCDCVDLTTVGQTAQVTNAGGAIHASLTTTPVQFASLCSGGGALCSGESYAGSTKPEPVNLAGGATPPAVPIAPAADTPPVAVLLPALELSGIEITNEIIAHPSLSP
jgi:hypothetical protein